MKRILLVIPAGGIGGMERLAENLFKTYQSEGYVVKVVKIIQQPSDIIGFGADEIALSTVDFSQMSSKQRYLFYFQIPVKLRKIIKKEQITHSISFGDMANLFSSLTGTSEYKIGSVHSLKSVELQHPNLFNRLTRIAYKSSYRSFNRLVCISQAIRKDLLENCGYRFPNNLDVIYNPHAISVYQQKAEEKMVEADLSIFEKPTVVFVGRITYQKAPWHLIAAFQLLKQKIADVQLVIIGDGVSEIEQKLHKQLDGYGIADAVHFLGLRSNPYPYFKAAQVVALSSFYEGTPNIIVESLAVGTPFVSTLSTDGITEMMTLDGQLVWSDDKLARTVTGIITPNFYNGDLTAPEQVAITENHHLMANALYEVLTTNTYREQVKLHQAEILKKYHIDLIAQAYLST